MRQAAGGLRPHVVRGRSTLQRVLQGGQVPVGRAVVEELSRTALSGWVEVPAAAPAVRVGLHVGDTEVAATWASDHLDRCPAHSVRGFSLRLRDLWDYVGPQDRLQVRVDGAPVPVVGHGLWVVPAAAGRHDADELRRLLADGRVFGRNGRLQLSKKLDREWQQAVMGLYERARAVLSERFGYDAFLVYGTLLGAVREGGPIGHDNDFDAAYVSAHTDGAAAARELVQVAFALIDAGFDVESKRTVLHLHDPQDRRLRIDLFHLFFGRRDRLCFPFGAAGTRSLRRRQWRGVREIEFMQRPALVPVSAEHLVEVLYGPGWRRPVPGFDWKRDRRSLARGAKVPHAMVEEVYWANFYAHNDFGQGSTFADHVLARDDLPTAVVDLGCGQGRDSLAFARAGRTVTGVDRSAVGVRHAAEKAAVSGLADRLAFSACDVSDVAALAPVLDASRERAGGGPLLFYARFFLHSVPEDVQEGLLHTLRQRSRPGDAFAAEFRTLADEPVAKVHGGHYRRYQDGPAFGRRLAEVHGFEVLEEQEGTGLSPYQGEDPVLYRVLARRP